MTSALVIVRWCSDETKSALLAPLVFDTSHDAGQFEPIDLDAAGGYKFMEVDVYACGLNYVAGPDLEEWFRALPWGRDGSAALIWETNGEEGGFVPIQWSSW